MSKQIGILVMCASLLVYACGCGTMKEVPADLFALEPHQEISGVQLTSGDTLTFDKGGATFAGGEIVGTLKDSTIVRTPISQIKTVSYFESAPARTVLVIGGAVLATGVVILAAVAVSQANNSGFSWR